MVPHIPGRTAPAPAADQEPQTIDAAGPSQGPGRMTGTYTGFGPLKQRIAACLPCFNAEAAQRPRVELPRPGEGPARSARGQLQWPDGRVSTGKVVQAQDGPVFVVASRRRDRVLAQRGKDKPARLRGGDPAPLPVAALPDDHSGRRFVPRLPQVLADHEFLDDGSLKIGLNYHEMTWPDEARPASRAAQTVGRQELANIVFTVGARNSSLDDMEQVTMWHLFGRSLDAVAAQCADPSAVRHAAQALMAPDALLILHTLPAAMGAREAGFAVEASFDADGVRATLAALAPGQSWLVRAGQKGREGDHAIGIALQKQANGNIRLSLINSNGWFPQARAQMGDLPALFKRVSPNQAVAALQDLLSGCLPPRPPDVSAPAWTHPARAHPLLAWWNRAGSVDTRISADFHGRGEPLRSSRQKSNDCTSECVFAFLVTVLPPADYKLAKAACLNTLVQIADRLEPPDTVAADAPLQVARRRLEQRITTSLSGHMVADRPAAAGR